MELLENIEWLFAQLWELVSFYGMKLLVYSLGAIVSAIVMSIFLHIARAFYSSISNQITEKSWHGLGVVLAWWSISGFLIYYAIEIDSWVILVIGAVSVLVITVWANQP